MSLSAPSSEQLRDFHLDCSLAAAKSGDLDSALLMLNEAVKAAPIHNSVGPVIPHMDLALGVRNAIDHWLPWLEVRYPDTKLIHDMKRASATLLVLAATHA